MVNLIDGLVREIHVCREEIASLDGAFEGIINDIDHSASESSNLPEYWCVVAHKDALIRTRLITEQSFFHLETLAVLAVTRYLFELTAWLKLLRDDPRFGFVYHLELAEAQRRYYEDRLNQLKREVALFQGLGEEERSVGVEGGAMADSQNIQALITAKASELDRKAARAMTLYGEQAKNNGYGFQAYLIESKAVPKAKEGLEAIENHLLSLRVSLPGDIGGLAKRYSRWVEKAKRAGMENDFHFIYSFTSRLLHATPASMTTNQKNLQPDEIVTLLKYCRICIADILDCARSCIDRFGQLPDKVAPVPPSDCN